MRTLILALFLTLPIGLAAQMAEMIPFEASAPLKLPPGLNFGEGAGVAVNSQGHIFAYTRTGSPGNIERLRAAQLFEFAADGTFIREIGENLYSRAWAHAVRIDREDNIWLVDNGSDLGVKLSPEGKIMNVFGRRRESISAGDKHLPGAAVPPARDGYFNEPTDVAFDPQGNAYFSDGYKNSRVAKYDKDGNWVMSFGERGSGPGQLRTPHGIQVDNQGRVYVADRSNNRIQVFDSDGNVLREITWEDVLKQAPVPDGYKPNIAHFGENPDGSYNSLWPNTLCITPGPNQVLFSQDMFPGRIYKMSLEGEVLGYFGRDGQQVGQLGWVHGIACPNENEVWISELLTWRIQRFLLSPTNQMSSR